jgi:DNA excision repair protein ERCC-4
MQTSGLPPSVPHSLNMTKERLYVKLWVLEAIGVFPKFFTYDNIEFFSPRAPTRRILMADIDLSTLSIATTKPRGTIAKKLRELGIQVAPIEEDEGNIDRYVLSKRLVVERRTGGGFIKGIMEKTLFTSAIYMREHFANPVLIIEGQVNYAYTGFDPQAIRGALSSMMLLYEVNVVSTPDVDETVELIVMMARQEQIGIPQISLIPKRKATSVVDMQRRLIEMLPGCGMVMARDLLQHFGTIGRIVGATEEEFCSLRGIGKKKAKQIVEVLQAEYGAIDTERHLEDAIEVEPGLLFSHPVELLDRQHHIFTEEKEKHIVDMVFRDSAVGEIILVELKRGKLELAHYRQLRRYLGHAHLSKKLKAYLDDGYSLRGILATVEECEFQPGHEDVTIQIVNRKHAIEVLKILRQARLGE